MPPFKFFPPEILDLIVDHSYDERTLKECCLVSKSWVPRARRHLFFHIEFTPQSPVKSWIKAFPDPSTSPAHHARVLSLYCLAAVGSAGTGALAWVRTFCNVVDLRIVSVRWNGNQTSLVPFHQLFPTLKSLAIYRCYIPPSELLGLICSFPLLEDLQLRLLSTRDTPAIDERTAPSTSPEFTGTLHLSGDFRSVLPTLLGLPNGFRFSVVVISNHVDDSDLTRDLVLGCSDTLKSLSVGYFTSNAHGAPFPFDLSKATKLTDLEFQLYTYTPTVQWITATLRTAKCPNLRRIRISSSMAFDPTEERTQEEWRELDCLLVRLWTSHSIRPEIDLPNRRGGGDLGGVAPGFLPELMAVGALDSIVS